MEAPISGDAALCVEYRSAQQRVPAPPRPEGTLKALPVPPAHKPAAMPILRLLMPVVMVAAMGAMVLVMFLSAGSVHPMMLVMPLMTAMGFLMMFSPQGGNDADETRRTYLRHLAQLRRTALDNAEAQRAHEVHRYPAPEDMWALVGSERMWERAAQDADALEVRIGVGVTSLCTPVDVADSGSTEDLDPVCAVSLRSTVRAVSTVPNTPVVVQLRAFRYLSIAGEQAQHCLRALLCSLAFSHGPETVGIEMPPGSAAWAWLKWLPHTRHPERAAHRIVVVDSPWEGREAGEAETIVEAGGDGALRRRAEEEGLALSLEEGI
ncbi:hypothetical protein [Corynebacterium lowii]|uniref:ESX-1 secretion system protein EccCa1 n=1 Tax=Corynebacterium lowii TaxID=1544413 RepID=A0A0Q0ZBM1_9CORY|nr:hypothetical protein [Corynebacterium lowii]KQB87420.1 ESX-1 secretion system protein EccCa1 [Corynebacterium lowii]MDP9851990.1 hypothetical protein [Corynebacterium lowii]